MARVGGFLLHSLSSNSGKHVLVRGTTGCRWREDDGSQARKENGIFELGEDILMPLKTGEVVYV